MFFSIYLKMVISYQMIAQPWLLGLLSISWDQNAKAMDFLRASGFQNEETSQSIIIHCRSCPSDDVTKSYLFVLNKNTDDEN